MDKILNLDNVDQYNSLYGLETLNPLVSVIDLNKATRQMDYGTRLPGRWTMCTGTMAFMHFI